MVVCECIVVWFNVRKLENWFLNCVQYSSFFFEEEAEAEYDPVLGGGQHFCQNHEFLPSRMEKLLTPILKAEILKAVKDRNAPKDDNITNEIQKVSLLNDSNRM